MNVLPEDGQRGAVYPHPSRMMVEMAGSITELLYR